MPKKIEDIVPNKKSIRDIPIPVRRIENTPPPPSIPPIKPKEPLGGRFTMPPERESFSPVRPIEPPVLPRLRTDFKNDFRVEEKENHETPKRASKKYMWWGGGVVLAFLVIFGALSLDAGATVAYTSKTQSLNFSNDTYTAYLSPAAGDLGYSVIKVSADKSASVAASGEETVSVKATGRIVIYNEQSSSQQLIKTTRFETADGKIYRLTSDVTVPAKGNLEVNVEADQPGDTYNIGLSDFTVPGLKGTSKFTSVYARSKTAMTGGFVGTRKKVSDADMAKVTPQLEDALKTELVSVAREQIPLEYILFPDLSTVSYTELPRVSNTDGTVKVGEHGDLNAVIMKRADLAKYLASKKLSSSTVDMEINDYSKLNVTFVNATADLIKDTSEPLKFSGSAVAIAKVDEDALKTALAGKTSDDVKNVLTDFPGLENISVHFRPFWKKAFPTDISKIKLERTNGS